MNSPLFRGEDGLAGDLPDPFLFHLLLVDPDVILVFEIGGQFTFTIEYRHLSGQRAAVHLISQPLTVSWRILQYPISYSLFLIVEYFVVDRVQKSKCSSSAIPR